MNASQSILILALLFTLVAGMVIYLTNPRRGVNQQFLVLSLTISFWLFSILLAFRSHHPGVAEFWMRTATAVGAFFPPAFALLRLSIINPKQGFGAILRMGKTWLGLYGMIAIYCFTPLYLLRAEFPTTGVPNAIYGSWAFVFLIYFIGALLWVFLDFVRSLRKTAGIQRGELQYVLMGLMNFFGIVLFATVIPLCTGNSQSAPFLPLWVILMNSIIAYGIATQRIMGVGVLVRRIVSYLLLWSYLATIYCLVWLVSRFILGIFTINSSFLPHLLSATTVVFTMSRVQNILQLFIKRLFINLHEVDLQNSLKIADSIFARIATTSELVRRFMEMLTKATGAESVAIFLFAHNDGKPVCSIPQELPMTGLAPGDSLPAYLHQAGKPLLGSMIPRLKPSQLLTDAGKQLAQLKGSLAVGIQTNEGLAGVVLLGAKLSGRMYDQSEQDALQILVNRLAVAFENARLYTEIQNAKVYNDILLDHLVSGVIAVDSKGCITVANREAQRIFGKTLGELIGKTMEVLPKEFSQLLQSALQSHSAIKDREIELKRENGPPAALRVGAALFHNGTGEVLGALMVLHDVSEVKELEMHVQHSDRLATIGKLSATMAHEIKNPLVAIKTFTQLLLERGQDTEFIASFSKIVSNEVERINQTVGELLGYARLGANNFHPIHVHDAVHKATGLLKPQLEKKGIKLATKCEAQNDLIQANHDRFQQILVNLLLNACEAIEKQGMIIVATQMIEKKTPGNGQYPSHWIALTIEDTGKGISPENLKRIFNPFFTTKQTGTGLGLSLTSSLVAAHKGTMDVESELGKGSRFFLQFPLCI